MTEPSLVSPGRLTAPAPSRPTGTPHASPGVTVWGVVHSEWIKFWTLRSNVVTLFGAAVLIVGLAAVLVAVREQGAAISVFELVNGMSWAQLVVAILAVVAACSEWAAGTAQTTFVAVPSKWPVLLAKALVLAAVAGAAGVVGVCGALVVGAVGGLPVWDDPALALRLCIGGGCFLAGLAVFSVAIGTIIRSLVAGLLTVVGVLWLLPMAVTLIPVAEIARLVAYLPAPAGSVLIAPERADAVLTPVAGGAVLAAWAVATSVVAIVSLRRRDA